MSELDRAWAEALLGRVVLGRYVLESVLGAGGMGAVFVATHQHMARRVAVKTMRPELAPSGELAERFVREAQAAASVGVKGVVPVTDLGHEPGIGPVLVMELLPGEVLHARIARVGRLDAREALGIARSLSDTLGAVHAHGIVHRDLKPANVLLARSPDGSELPTILDFGLARVARAMRETALTIPGTVLGTPRYMSPEQLGAIDVDARADLYAVGAILHHALAGRPPYADVPRERVYEALAKRPPASLESLREGLAPAVYALVARAMQRDREARFQTAAAMRDAIDEALGVPPRAAQPCAVLPTVNDRRRASPSHAVAVAVGLPHGARVTGADRSPGMAHPRSEPVAQASGSKESKGSRPFLAWIAAGLAALVVAVACVVVAVFVLRDVRPVTSAGRPSPRAPALSAVVSPVATAPVATTWRPSVPVPAPRPSPAAIDDVVRRLSAAARTASSREATEYELHETTVELQLAVRDAEALGTSADPLLARTLGVAYYAEAALAARRFLGPIRLRSASDCGAARGDAMTALTTIAGRVAQAEPIGDSATRACDLEAVATLELQIARSFEIARATRLAEAPDCATAALAAREAVRVHLGQAAREPGPARCVRRAERALRDVERSLDDAQPR